MIKEMEYKDKRNESAIVLYKGKYKGVMIIAVSYGTHPCAYVFFKKDHYMYGKNEDDANGIVGVHGGFTYCSGKSRRGLLFVDTGEYEWGLGWDYAHGGDKLGGSFSLPDDKPWTTQEMIAELRECVDEIVYKTPVEFPIETNPLLDVLLSRDRGDGHIIYKVVSKDPARDYLCNIRMVRTMKDVTKNNIDRLAGIPVYVIKCEYCGKQFISNSSRVKTCCDFCKARIRDLSTKKYLQKYMKENRKKIGYSSPCYAKKREKILEMYKMKKLKTPNFVCKKCGKTFYYMEDHYHLSSKICRDCKKPGKNNA